MNRGTDHEMNHPVNLETSCYEIDLILDANAPDALTFDQKQAVDRHFASCCECRAAWAAYRELAAAPIPKSPPALRLRIAAALATTAARRPHAVRRSLAVGGLFVVGAAVAATVALRLADRVPALTQPVDEQAPAVAAPTPSSAAESMPLSLAPLYTIEDADTADELGGATSDASSAESSTDALALDAYSIVVLLVPNTEADARSAAWLAQCHEQVVQQLTAVRGLNVIAGEHVSAYAGSDLPPEEIARQLGAGSVLVVSTMDQATLDQVAAGRAELGLDPGAASCRAQHLDAQIAAEPSVVGFVDPGWQPDRPRAFAESVAERVEAALEGRATVITEAQATVLNTAFSDRERVAALQKLRQGPEFTEPHMPGADGATARSPLPLIALRASLEPIPGAYTEAVVAAAAQIGLTSPDGRARESAWQGLRGIRHPYAVQALLTSLANDASENVRRAAALALGYLADEPGVRDGLTQAAAEDPSEDPPVPCCIPSVREAARRALRSDEALRESALSTVLDETLPSAERLRPLYQSIDGRGFPVRLSDEAARAVFEIGRSANDAIMRSRAWDSLGSFRNADFTQTLLADLADDPAENVRASAAAALKPYVDDPVVLAALEQAEADPAMSVRRAARSALDGGGR